MLRCKTGVGFQQKSVTGELTTIYRRVTFHTTLLYCMYLASAFDLLSNYFHVHQKFIWKFFGLFVSIHTG